MVDIQQGFDSLHNSFDMYNKINIGEGSFGCVYQVESYYDEQLYAIKIQEVESFSSYVRLIKEMSLMSQIGVHPNLIKIYKHYTQEGKYQDDTYQQCDCSECQQLFKKQNIKNLNRASDNDKVIKYSVATVMELGDLSLQQQILINKKNKINVKETQVLEYLKQSLNGLYHLKKRKIYHRDIKPSNIIIKNDKIKLLDFGLSKVSTSNLFEGEDDDSTREHSLNGTRAYFSPEIQLEQEKINLEKSDIFSLGQTFLEFLHNENVGLSFDTFNVKTKQLKKQIKVLLDKINNENLKYLLIQMLDVNERSRPGIIQCLYIIECEITNQEDDTYDSDDNQSFIEYLDQENEYYDDEDDDYSSQDSNTPKPKPLTSSCDSSKQNSLFDKNSFRENNKYQQNNKNKNKIKNIFNDQQTQIINHKQENQQKNHTNAKIKIKDFIYEGQTLNNQPDGVGILENTQKNEKYIGEFKNGKKSGKGSYYYKDGSIFDGEWQDDQKNGNGQLILKNGDISEGIWLNDVKEGKHLVKNSNGKIIKNNFYNNGKLRKSLKYQ